MWGEHSISKTQNTLIQLMEDGMYIRRDIGKKESTSCGAKCKCVSCTVSVSTIK